MTFFIWANCFTSCDTAWTEVPDPWAIRRLREPSMICGFARSCGRHRQDDRLEPVQLLLVTWSWPSCLPTPGHHPQQVLQRAHLAHLLHLVQEVVERELLLADLPLELLGLALVHLPLGLLDERHDVAHPEDPLGHPVGVEALEVAELLPVEA